MILQLCDYVSITRRGETHDPRPLICRALAYLRRLANTLVTDLPVAALILTIMHVQTMGWRNEDQLGDYGIIADMVVGCLFLSSRPLAVLSYASSKEELENCFVRSEEAYEE